MSGDRLYRIALRLFPRRWRQLHGAEVLASLREAEPPTRATVVAEAASLFWWALVVWTRELARLGRRLASSPAAVAAIAAAGTVTAAGAVAAVRSGGITTGFLLTSLVVAAIPGTGVLFTVSTAVRNGSWQGLIAAAGCTLGIVPHLIAAAVGLSGLMQAGSTVFELVRYAGVAYLVLLAVSMLREGDFATQGAGEAAAEPIGRVLRRAIVLNLLNPKLTVFFFAFLPPFLDPSTKTVDPRLLALGGVFMVITFVVFAVYAIVSAWLRDRIVRARRARLWFQRTLAGLLVAFGARLALNDR